MMSARRYVVPLNAAKPFTVEADSIFTPISGFSFLVKGAELNPYRAR